MARGEEVPASVDVDDDLAGLDALALHQLVELALLFFDRAKGRGGRVLAAGAWTVVVGGTAGGGPAQLCGPRRMPVPHVAARGAASLVGGVVFDALQHGLARLQALGLAAGALVAGQALLERLDKVRLGAEQHAADEVGGGDAGGALDDLEALGLLDVAVAVLAVAVRGDVVAVDDVVAAVVGDPGQRGDVGGPGDGLGGPAAGLDGHDALVEAHHRGALVLEDGLVRVDADEQLGAQLAGLQHGAGMSWAGG